MVEIHDMELFLSDRVMLRYGPY